MANEEYTLVASDETEKDSHSNRPIDELNRKWNPRHILGVVAMTLVCFTVGFASGMAFTSSPGNHILLSKGSLLSPQSLLPAISIKSVKFRFPSGYEDISERGDTLWNEMMPVGSGFVRVPYPRMYNMPPSKTIPGDHEFAELYSMSMTHQLHCLAVLRHVIMKYEVHDKSRFAGAGHEYHCLDYIRQAILCAGDTTLDHAEIVLDENGSDQKSGFTGSNSVHVCRDWDVIRAFLEDHRAGNRTGILI